MMKNTLDKQALRRQRIEQLLGECMDRHEIDLWLVYTREISQDPLGVDVGLDRVVARAAGLFARRGNELHRRAMVASYDTTPVEESGIYEQVIGFRQEGIAPHLRRAIEELAPRRVALNFSRDATQADGLSYGMRLHLEEILGAELFERVVSAEPLVTAFRARKLPEELTVMRQAVIITQNLITQALSPARVKAGVTTEADLGAFLEESTRAAGGTVAFTQVMVGPCRGHADPTDRVIQPGDLVRIDFGIFLEGYSSDIQRTAYVLRPGESEAPAEVQRLFDVTLAACQAGIAALRPGALGRDVDRAARAVITDAGYDEYPHATGHAIGLETHELGPVLGPPWKERYGTTVEQPLEPGMIFAVEPAAYPELPACGGEVQVGIEEDVIVTEEAPEIIGTPQTELILLPG